MTPSIGSMVEDLRFRTRSWMGVYPRLYYAGRMLLGHERRLEVERGDDIVIEGFPRSANSFAVVAFLHAQPEEMKIAHHVHAPAQIMRAARFDLPAVVLIRDPLDAVASLLLKTSGIEPTTALRGYVRFYKAIRPHRSAFVVAAFPEVTEDFGRTIERINRRLGTEFEPFNHTPNNEKAVLDEVQRIGTDDPIEVARPTQPKQHVKESVKSTVRESARNELQEAREIYQAYLEDLQLE